MALSKLISNVVESITRTTFQFNKTLDVLIERFKDSCPTTPELRSLIRQKNEINGALQQIEQKISTLNKVAQGSEIAVQALKAGKTIIKQIPIPTAIAGVGIPVSIINNFSDALDNLGTLIDKEDAAIGSIPEALDIISSDVGEVITKLTEFDVVLNSCLEKDPNITQEDLDSITATTENFVGVLTNEQLEEILNTPPGLLYGNYYLRLNFIDSGFSFNKKQVIAQNKGSVPPPGEFYNVNTPIEEILGNESFSSSNIVLVDEMKWKIDTKDLIYVPPPPAEDPEKIFQREGQVTILMAIYGADREEAEELYELAWDLSQNKGPTAANYFDQLVQEAFDNSRTLLEQAVANEGYEWQQGDRILDATIKKLFLADFANTVSEEGLNSEIGIIRKLAILLLDNAKDVGGNYNDTTKRWDQDGNFIYSSNTRLYQYSERLALTAENLFNDATIGDEFISLRPEMARRKPLMQAIFEIANERFLAGRPYNFNDPLKEYFFSKDQGYNQPIINEIPISGNANELITTQEISDVYQSELNIIDAINLAASNLVPPNYDETSYGLNYQNRRAYAKTQVFLKLKQTLGINWYNQNAQAASELPFWSPGGGNPNSSSYNQNNVNNGLSPDDKWYFEFGRNGLPVPTG